MRAVEPLGPRITNAVRQEQRKMGKLGDARL